MFFKTSNKPISFLPKEGIHNAKLDKIINLADRYWDGSYRNELTYLVFTVQVRKQIVRMCKVYPTPEKREIPSELSRGMEAWICALAPNRDPNRYIYGESSWLIDKPCRILIAHKIALDGVYADVEAILPSKEDADLALAAYKYGKIGMAKSPSMRAYQCRYGDYQTKPRSAINPKFR